MHNEYMINIFNKIENKTLKIGIIGMGYVGLPLSISYAEKGLKVYAFDIDKEKINSINNGKSYFKHIESEKIKNLSQSSRIVATNDFSLVKKCDVVIICVPTPLNKFREPDLKYIKGTLQTIHPYLKKGQLFSLESTTYPGTTNEIVKPQILEKGFNIGEDFFVIFSPEREDPGNTKYQNTEIPKVIGGITKNCLSVGEKVYGIAFCRIHPVSTTQTAEFTKLLENIYRSVNIGLVNEMKMIADKMDINIWEVIDAASTKPFGFTPFYPGPGWGGHCIPIDPFYLTWRARAVGVNTKFIELAGEINVSMPEWVVTKMMDGFNDRKKTINGSNILLLGLAYKKNIDDIRESPAVKIMEILKTKGANIYYSDPYIPVFPKMRNHFFDLNSIEVNKEILNKMDCVIIVTDHDDFDYDFILKNSSFIVDTRGKYREDNKNVLRC